MLYFQKNKEHTEMWNVVDIWQGACYQNVLFSRLWENWIRSHSFWHPVWDWLNIRGFRQLLGA